MSGMQTLRTGGARGRWFLLLAIGMLAGLIAAWHWWARASGPDDPRLTFATPYRNVRPDVQYVGDAVCAGCHERQAQTYRDHPMGRSLAPVGEAVSVERHAKAAHNPFEALGFQYAVEVRDSRVMHREWVNDEQGRAVCAIEAEVHYAVGSGARGRTYLVNRDGYLFQSPITWYTQ